MIARGYMADRGVDYLDNHVRFGLLNRAALEISRHIFRTDVFHGHDWQAGLLAPYLRATFAADPTFFGIKTVLTIHNLGYQGNFPMPACCRSGARSVVVSSEGLEFYGRMSFLKAGIVWADAVTTVSPTYAREIQTPEYGFGMDGLLRSRAAYSPEFSTASTTPNGTRPMIPTSPRLIRRITFREGA